MRVSEFWERMHQQFGQRHAEVIATDQVIGELGGRTPRQALDAGIEPREVWLAVCARFDVPVGRRH